LIHQERNTGNDAENWSAQISFSEPLSKRFSLHTTYNYRASVNNDKRLVSDIQDSGQLLLNEQQSNHLLSDVFQHITTLGVQADYKKLDFGARVRWENTFLKGGVFLQEAAVNRQYDYLLPSFNLTYRPKQSKTINFDLNQSLNLPSIRQLQPVQEVTDALRYYIGTMALCVTTYSIPKRVPLSFLV
jgi:outer membrane receptor protein involved in Fe transport